MFDEIKKKYDIPTETSPVEPNSDLFGDVKVKYGITPPAQTLPQKIGGAIKTSGQFLAGALAQPIESTIRTATVPIAAGIKSAYKGTNFADEYTNTLQNFAPEKTGSVTSFVSGGQVQALPRDLRTEKLKAAGDVISAIPIAKGATIAKGVTAKLGGGLLGKIGAGASLGYLTDVGLDLQQGKSTQEVLTPGLGTVLGATLPTLPAIAKAITPKGKEEAFKQAALQALPVKASESKVPNAVQKKVNNALTVVKDIVDNPTITDDLGNIKKGSSLTFQELQTTNQDRMKKLYAEYTSKLADADKNVFQNTLNQKKNEIISNIEQKLLVENSETNRKAMSSVIRELKGLRDASPEGIQNYIETLNREAKGIPGAGLTAKQVQSANLSGELRKILDDSIENIGGAGYQDLRNVYAAHRQLRDQISSQALKEMKNTPGFTDTMTNLGLTYEGVKAILSGNPQGLVGVFGAKLGGKLMKNLNSAERGLSKMFKLVESGYSSPKASEAIKSIAPNIMPPMKNNIISNTIPQPSNLASKIVENSDDYLNSIKNRTLRQQTPLQHEAFKSKVEEISKNISTKRLIREETYQKAVSNFKENMNRINSGIPIDQIKDLGIITLYHVENGIKNSIELGKKLAEAGYKLTKEQVENLFNKYNSSEKLSFSEKGLNLKTIASRADKEDVNTLLNYADEYSSKTLSDTTNKATHDVLKGMNIRNSGNLTQAQTKKVVNKILDKKIPTNILPAKKVITPENQLIQEAKKYNSAEEFVKAQGTPKTVQVWNKSKFSNDGAYADIPVIRKEENITLYQGGSDEGRQFWTTDKKYAEQFGKVTEKTGDFYKVDNGNRVTDVYIEAPTKSQLIDIYNKAVGTAKKVELPSYKGETVDNLAEEAKKYNSAEEFVNAQNKKEYRTIHQIDTKMASSIVDIEENTLNEFIDEFKKQYGYPALKTKEINKLKSIISNPNADITIYRASPKNELNSGDWVTIDKDYANDIKRQNGGKVYTHTVKAKDLFYPKTIDGFKELPSLNKWGAFQYNSSQSKSQLEQIWKEANK